MGFKENLAELKSYSSAAPAANQSKIDHIVSLYEAKRTTFNSALSKTLLLASTNENTIKSGRAEKEYAKVVAKFGKPNKSKEEIKAELKKGRRKVREAGKKLAETKAWLEAETKEYSVKVVLYASAENTSNAAEKKEEETAKKKKTKYFKGLRQVSVGEWLLTLKHPMVNNAEQFFREAFAATANHRPRCFGTAREGAD